MNRRTTQTLIVLIALLAAALPATAEHGEGEKSKHRRVVRVVMADEEGSEPGYFVVGPDGEHVAAHSFFFRRGGYLGVQLTDLTPELRRHFGVPEESGVMISGVSEEGPAATAGTLWTERRSAAAASWRTPSVSTKRATL
jgi:hypothetical protein